MSVVITDPYDLLQDRFCHMMNFDGFHDLGTVHKAIWTVQKQIWCADAQ